LTIVAELLPFFIECKAAGVHRRDISYSAFFQRIEKRRVAVFRKRDRNDLSRPVAVRTGARFGVCTLYFVNRYKGSNNSKDSPLSLEIQVEQDLIEKQSASDTSIR